MRSQIKLSKAERRPTKASANQAPRRPSLKHSTQISWIVSSF
jgi:hypothetical protein